MLLDLLRAIDETALDTVRDHIARCGWTPLLIACQDGNAKVVAALLTAGAAVNLKAGFGATPLCMACEYGHARVVAALLAAGAAVDQAAANSAFPLYLACQDGHTVVVSLLLAAGAAVDTTMHDGRTALSVACSQGHLACVKLLSSYGACQSVGHAAIMAAIMAERAGYDDVCASDVCAWLILSLEVTLRLELKTVLAQ